MRETQDYTIKKGDTLEGIAKKFGHRDIKGIWNDSANKVLVARRKKPDQLQAGDKLVIPPNERQQKELDKKIADLNRARDAAVAGLAALRDEIDRVQHKLKVFNELIADSQKTTDQIVAELEKNLAGMRGWATGVDAVKKAIDIGSALGKLCRLGFKAAKATGEELLKLNKEALRSVGEMKKDQSEDLAIKVASSFKENANTGVAFVGTVAESWEKMTAPSFWANTVVQMTQNGKSWSEAVSSDIGEDIEDRIKQVQAQGDRTVKGLRKHVSELKGQLSEYNRYAPQFETEIKRLEKEAASLQ